MRALFYWFFQAMRAARRAVNLRFLRFFAMFPVISSLDNVYVVADGGGEIEIWIPTVVEWLQLATFLGNGKEAYARVEAMVNVLAIAS